VRVSIWQKPNQDFLCSELQKRVKAFDFAESRAKQHRNIEIPFRNLIFWNSK